MKKSLLSKFISSLTIVALILILVPQSVIASTTVISAISDTMSTQVLNTNADHTISWMQATGHAITLADTVAIAFTVSGDFTAGGTWQTSDFALTTNVGSNVAPGAVNAACSGSGATNYKVDISGTVLPVFTITACTGWTTITTGSTVTFVIKGATGGTGTLLNKNADVNNSTFTITDTGSNTDNGSGAVVIETNDVVTVTGVVAASLTLAISSNAFTLSPNPITSSGISTGNHTITTATNAAGGFAITYNGPTLTSGANTITAVGGTAASSSPGSEQFGFNLAVTTTTSGTCTADAQYNNATKYAFVASTTTTITAETAPASCVFTANYGANITSTTEAGTYTSAITYIDTGTF